MDPAIITSRTAPSPRYPILAFIDAARGDLLPRFAEDPCAEALEQCARRLTSLYWSDLVWITGSVPASCFRHVCEELERERAAQVAVLRKPGSAA